MTRKETLPRQLGVLGIWVLAINGILGAGIFGVPSKVHGHVGDYGPLAFLACGLILVPVVLSIAAVASYFRQTGGPVLYTRTAFGKVAAFQTGWAYYVTRITAFAANAGLMVDATTSLLPSIHNSAWRTGILGLVIGGLTWVNVVGSRHAMRSMGILTLLKFLPLVVLLVAGVQQIQAATITGGGVPLPPLENLGPAAPLIIYAFVGWENALVPAGEAKNPGRHIPIALLLALATATVLYVLIQAIATATVPDLASSKRPLVDAGQALLGSSGKILLLFGVIASVAGNLGATIFSVPRVTYAMAQERTLPAAFGYVHPEFQTPSVSILVFGAAAFGLAVFGDFALLAGMSTVVRVLMYLACIATLPVLRRRMPDAQAMRLPGGWALPIIGALVCIALLTQVTLYGALTTGVFLLIGTAIYLFRPK